MSARSRQTTASVKPIATARPAPAGAASDEPLNELRARVQEALDELEEQRSATDALKKSLALAEQRVAAFESGEADRLRESLSDHDPGRYVAELEERRRERVALEERARAEDARRLASAEKRLRTTEATLAQTLQALEEHRVTAVEQRMIAQATEHHATGLEQQMHARVQRAEALAAESKAVLEDALQVSEERRIAAAEMKTILDATEYRLAQLERERNGLALERSAWDAERAALRADAETAGVAAEQQRAELTRQVDELRGQAEQLKAERASTTTALERTLAEVAIQRDVAAGLGIERDAAIADAEKLAWVAAERARALSESRQQIAALEAASLATAKTLEQTTAELTTQRETAAQAQQQWDQARAGLQGELTGVQHELAARAARIEALEATGAALSQERGSLDEELRAVSARLAAVETDRAAATAALEDTGAQLAVARSEAGDLATARQAAAERVAQLEQEIAAGNTALADTRSALEAERATRATLTAELAAATATIAERDRAAQGLETQRLALEETRHRLAQQVEALQARARQLAAQLTDATAGLSAGRDELARATAATEELQATYAALRQTLAEREREVTSARADREQEGAARTAVAKELKAAQARLAEQTRGTQALEAHANALTHELAEQRTHGEQVQVELQSIVAQLEEQRRVSGVAAAEHHTVAQHLREVEEALGRRDHDLEELHATLTRERDEWTAARSELLASLEREGGAQQDLVAARQALEEKLHAVETELHGERDRAVRLNEERAQVATALALVREELKEQLDAAAAVAEERDATRERLRASEAAAAETAHRLDEAIATHKREWTEWESASSERDAELAATRGRLDATTTERNTLAATLEEERTARTQSETQRAQLEGEKTQVASQLTAATKQIAALRHELGGAQTKGSQAAERVSRLEADLQGLQRELQEAQARHTAAGQEQAQRQQTLEKRLADTEAARVAAVEAGRKAQATHGHAQKGLQSELEQVRRQLQDRTAAVERSDRALQEVCATAADLERQLAELQQTREAAVRAQSQLTESLRAVGDQRTALERQVVELEKARDVVLRDHAKATQSLRAVTEQRATLDGQVAELQEANAAAVKERERLTAALRVEGDQRSALERQVAEVGQARDAAMRAQEQVTQSLHAEGEQRAALQRQVAKLEKARAAAVSEHGQAAQALRTEGEQRAALERQVAELQKTRAATAKEQERLTEALRVAAEQQTALAGQMQADGAERAQLQAEMGRLGEARTALQQHLQDTQTQLSAEQGAARELRDLHAHGTELYQLVETELQQTRGANDAACKQVEELTAALGGRDRDLARVQAGLADAERHSREEHARTEQLSAELSALTRMRDELRTRVEALSDRDKIAARAAELERRLAETDKQGDGLRAQLTETQDQLHEAMQRGAAAAAAAGDVATLQAQLAEHDTESQRLRAQVENLSGQRDVLQRERDQLKRRAQEADDAERVREEQQRLLEKLGEVERQQGEATQRHSAAVSGYMVELNQRSELLRQRELQIERLTEELRVVQHACEDGMSQVGGLRQERDLLDLRVRELESAAQAPRAAAAAKPAASEGLRLAPPETAGAGTDKPAPAAKGPVKAPAAPPQAKPAPMAPAAKASPAAASPPAASVSAPAASTGKGLKPSRNASGVLNVVHLEDGAPLRDAVKTSVGRFGRVKYTTAEDAPATVNPPTLLTINLLVKSIDPLVTLAHADAWGVQAPQAFAYCTDGTRGTIIGLADFYPHPFDIEGCAARINDREGGTQRLLVVGESVELLNQIRSTMNRIRCSTSVALDARQAFDLVSMVKPQVVLVDVGLQRAEGLRLIARLRTDPAYAGVGIGLMWTRDLDANEFRTHVARAVRDSPFSVDDLGRSVAQTVAALGFASEQLRDAG